MMRLECQRARALIDARAGGLAEAERLRLEAHLGGCPRCAADADALEAVRTYLEPGATLSHARRERALANALLVAQQPVSTHPRAPGRVVVFGGVGMALAAAAAAWLMASRPAPEVHGLASTRVAATPVQPSTPASVAPIEHAQAPTARERLVAGDEVRFEAPERVQLAHAVIELAAQTRVRWDAQAATLHLLAGEANAHVDPAPKQRFVVATERFSVIVTGTRFSTNVDGVRVDEGSVRIEAPDGSVLQASLSAGQRWAYTPAPSTAKVATSNDESAMEPAIQASRWLTLARKRLAARDVDAARDALDKALAGKASRIERAEALTLRAECALAQGRLDEALAGYGEVAERYRRLPAGDNALFAAAGLAARRGDAAHAQRLYARYVERYPDGRFAAEATKALGREHAAATSE